MLWDVRWAGECADGVTACVKVLTVADDTLLIRGLKNLITLKEKVEGHLAP